MKRAHGLRNLLQDEYKSDYISSVCYIRRQPRILVSCSGMESVIEVRGIQG